jgi:hypothetical protein
MEEEKEPKTPSQLAFVEKVQKAQIRNVAS